MALGFVLSGVGKCLPCNKRGFARLLIVVGGPPSVADEEHCSNLRHAPIGELPTKQRLDGFLGQWHGERRADALLDAPLLEEAID